MRPKENIYSQVPCGDILTLPTAPGFFDVASGFFDVAATSEVVVGMIEPTASSEAFLTWVAGRLKDERFPPLLRFTTFPMSKK